MIYQVIVTSDGGKKLTIDLCEDEKEMQQITVIQLKLKIAEKFPGDRGRIAADMKLIFGNKRLEEDKKRLTEYGIIHKSAIYMVISLDGGLTADLQH